MVAEQSCIYGPQFQHKRMYEQECLGTQARAGKASSSIFEDLTMLLFVCACVCTHITCVCIYSIYLYLTFLQKKNQADLAPVAFACTYNLLDALKVGVVCFRVLCRLLRQWGLAYLNRTVFDLLYGKGPFCATKAKKPRTDQTRPIFLFFNESV